MAGQYLEVVRSIFAASERDDLEGMLSRLSEEIVILDTTRVDGGVYRGFEGVVDWMAEWSEMFDWSIQADEFRESVHGVVVLGHWDNVARATGLRLRSPFAMVFRLDRGLVVSLDYFNDQAAALEAVGAANGSAT